MKYPNQMTKEEAGRLFTRYRETGDKAIRNQLVENYMYLPKVLVKKYGYRPGDIEDIFQVACLGLMYAVERYDPEKGFAFDTFATPTIVGEIKKYYRDKQYLIRVPRRIQELNRAITKARTMLEHEQMKTPTISDIADYLSVTEEEVIEAMEGVNAYYPRSLTSEVETGNDGQETLLMDMIGEEDAMLANVENIDGLRRRLSELNPVERMIVEERYYNGKTQREVADMIGKSQMTVSRLEKKVMEKLRMGLTN